MKVHKSAASYDLTYGAFPLLHFLQTNLEGRRIWEIVEGIRIGNIAHIWGWCDFLEDKIMFQDFYL